MKVEYSCHQSLYCHVAHVAHVSRASSDPLTFGCKNYEQSQRNTVFCSACSVVIESRQLMRSQYGVDYPSCRPSSRSLCLPCCAGARPGTTLVVMFDLAGFTPCRASTPRTDGSTMDLLMTLRLFRSFSPCLLPPALYSFADSFLQETPEPRRSR